MQYLNSRLTFTIWVRRRPGVAAAAAARPSSPSADGQLAFVQHWTLFLCLSVCKVSAVSLRAQALTVA